MGDIILTMKGIDKSFPGVHALDHVDLEIRKGEVLALMGENGAGKSTLMKVLTGIYTKDSGTITYEGKEVEFHNTREAQDAGIVIVHQELNMLGHLTVAQNIFIGREFRKGFKIDDKKMNEEEQRWESIEVADADVVIVAYGISARVAEEAVKKARAQGIKLGLIRPKTVVPFPEKAFSEIKKDCKGILIVEMNVKGQMKNDVLVASKCKYPLYGYFTVQDVPKSENIIAITHDIIAGKAQEVK